MSGVSRMFCPAQNYFQRTVLPGTLPLHKFFPFHSIKSNLWSCTLRMCPTPPTLHFLMLIPLFYNASLALFFFYHRYSSQTASSQFIIVFCTYLTAYILCVGLGTFPIKGKNIAVYYFRILCTPLLGISADLT